MSQSSRTETNCLLLPPTDRTSSDVQGFFISIFFFFSDENTKQIRLFWIARSSFCSKHYRHKTKYIKKAKTRKTLSASDTAIHSEGFEFGVYWITDGKSGSNTSSLLFLTVSLCFLLPSTNDNKSPLLSWCHPPGWRFQPQHPSSNTEKHVTDRQCPNSLFDSYAGSESIRSLLCCVVHSLLCSGRLLTLFFTECALISTNLYKYDGRTECSV